MAKNKRRRSRVQRVLLAVSLCLVLAMTGYEAFVKISHAQLMKQATESAVSYIQNKYGIDAQITDSEEREGYGTIHGCIVFKMTHDGQEFKTYVDTYEKPYVCCDDKQLDEIKAAVIDSVKNKLPDGEVVDFSIGRTVESGLQGAAFDTYYNEKNLGDVMTDTYGKLEMVFWADKLDSKAAGELLSDYNIDYCFTSFDSEERCREFLKLRNKPLAHTSFASIENIESYELYAPYITDYIEVSGSDKSLWSFETKKYDEFSYAYFPTLVDRFEKNSSEVKIEEISQSVITDIFEKNGGEWLKKPLDNKAYRFETKYGDVCVYYPLSKLSGYDAENIGAAYVHQSGFSNNWDISRAVIVGDYAVFVLPINHQCFMLVDLTGLPEFVPSWKAE